MRHKSGLRFDPYAATAGLCIPLTEHADLSGQFLIAMPQMGDTRFDRAVIFLHHHDRDGAVGFVVNKRLPMTYQDLMDAAVGEAAIDPTVIREDALNLHVGYGGPVEETRGFVLTARRAGAGTAIEVDASLDALKGLLTERPDRSRIVVLGYAGWGEGQLDGEMAKNVWLSGRMDPMTIFSADPDNMYDRAMRGIGVDPGRLIHDAGRA